MRSFYVAISSTKTIYQNVCNFYSTEPTNFHSWSNCCYLGVTTLIMWSHSESKTHARQMSWNLQNLIKPFFIIVMIYSVCMFYCPECIRKLYTKYINLTFFITTLGPPWGLHHEISKIKLLFSFPDYKNATNQLGQVWPVAL